MMINKLKQLTNQMEYMQFQGDLHSYEYHNNKLIYLTNKQLSSIDIGIQPKKQSIPINGENVIVFAVGGNGYVALLYITSTVEIRRIGKLQQVLFQVQSVQFDIQKATPLLKWQMHQLYCIYQDKVQIIDVIYKKRYGYTNLTEGYPNSHLIDILHSKMMDGQKLSVLKQKERLIFSILPLPVTHLDIRNITDAFMLMSPKQFQRFRRQYLVLITQNRYLKVFDFINLRQICQIDFKTQVNNQQALAFIKQPYNEFILIKKYKRKKDKKGEATQIEIICYYLLCINKQQYYMKERESFFKQDVCNFFKYCVKLPFKQNNLFLLTNHRQIIQRQVYSSIDMSYISHNKIFLLSYLVKDKPQNDLQQFKEYHKVRQWKQNSQWQGIITSYIQMSDQLNQTFPRSTMTQIQKSSEEIQSHVNQFKAIQNDFQDLVQQFHMELYKKSLIEQLTFKSIQQEQIFIQKEWNKFFQNYLKENNFDINQQNFIEIQIKKGPPQLKKVRSRQNLHFNTDNKQFVLQLQTPQKQTIPNEQEKSTLQIVQQIAKKQEKYHNNRQHPRGTLQQLTKIQKQKLQKQKQKYLNQFAAANASSYNTTNITNAIINDFDVKKFKQKNTSPLRYIDKKILEELSFQQFISINSHLPTLLIESLDVCKQLINQVCKFIEKSKDYLEKLIQICKQYCQYEPERFKYAFLVPDNQDQQQILINPFKYLLLQTVQQIQNQRKQHQFSAKLLLSNNQQQMKFKEVSQRYTIFIYRVIDIEYEEEKLDNMKNKSYIQKNKMQQLGAQKNQFKFSKMIQSYLQNQADSHENNQIQVVEDDFDQQNEQSYQRFVKKFLTQLQQRQKQERRQKELKMQKQKQRQKQLAIYAYYQQKLQNSQITIDQVNQQLLKSPLNEQFTERIRLKMLQIRFRQVVLGHKDLPDPQQIDRIFGKISSNSIQDNHKKQSQIQSAIQDRAQIDKQKSQYNQIKLQNPLKNKQLENKTQDNTKISQTKKQVQQLEAKQLQKKIQQTQKFNETFKKSSILEEQSNNLDDLKNQRLQLSLKIQKMNQQADKQIAERKRKQQQEKQRQMILYRYQQEILKSLDFLQPQELLMAYRKTKQTEKKLKNNNLSKEPLRANRQIQQSKNPQSNKYKKTVIKKEINGKIFYQETIEYHHNVKNDGKEFNSLEQQKNKFEGRDKKNPHANVQTSQLSNQMMTKVQQIARRCAQKVNQMQNKTIYDIPLQQDKKKKKRKKRKKKNNKGQANNQQKDDNYQNQQEEDLDFVQTNRKQLSTSLVQETKHLQQKTKPMFHQLFQDFKRVTQNQHMITKLTLQNNCQNSQQYKQYCEQREKIKSQIDQLIQQGVNRQKQQRQNKSQIQPNQAAMNKILRVRQVFQKFGFMPIKDQKCLQKHQQSGKPINLSIQGPAQSFNMKLNSEASSIIEQEINLDQKIKNCRQVVIQNVEKTLQHKQVYLYFICKKIISEIKTFSLNSNDGVIKIEFHQPSNARAFYNDLNFKHRITSRPFNIYLNLQLKDNETKKYFIQGLTQQNQRTVFDAARKISVVQLDTKYNDSSTQSKLKPKGVLIFIRKDQLSQNQFKQLQNELKKADIKISPYVNDKKSAGLQKNKQLNQKGKNQKQIKCENNSKGTIVSKDTINPNKQETSKKQKKPPKKPEQPLIGIQKSSSQNQQLKKNPQLLKTPILAQTKIQQQTVPLVSKKIQTKIQKHLITQNKKEQHPLIRLTKTDIKNLKKQQKCKQRQQKLSHSTSSNNKRSSINNSSKEKSEKVDEPIQKDIKSKQQKIQQKPTQQSKRMDLCQKISLLDPINYKYINYDPIWSLFSNLPQFTDEFFNQLHQSIIKNGQQHIQKLKKNKKWGSIFKNFRYKYIDITETLFPQNKNKKKSENFKDNNNDLDFQRKLQSGYFVLNFNYLIVYHIKARLMRNKQKNIKSAKFQQIEKQLEYFLDNFNSLDIKKWTNYEKQYHQPFLELIASPAVQFNDIDRLLEQYFQKMNSIRQKYKKWNNDILECPKELQKHEEDQQLKMKKQKSLSSKNNSLEKQINKTSIAQSQFQQEQGKQSISIKKQPISQSQKQSKSQAIHQNNKQIKLKNKQEPQVKRQYVTLNQNIIELIYDLDDGDQVIQKMKKQMAENIDRQFQKNKQKMEQLNKRQQNKSQLVKQSQSKIEVVKQKQSKLQENKQQSSKHQVQNDKHSQQQNQNMNVPQDKQPKNKVELSPKNDNKSTNLNENLTKKQEKIEQKNLQKQRQSNYNSKNKKIKNNKKPKFVQKVTSNLQTQNQSVKKSQTKPIDIQKKLKNQNSTKQLIQIKNQQSKSKNNQVLLDNIQKQAVKHESQNKGEHLRESQATSYGKNQKQQQQISKRQVKTKSQIIFSYQPSFDKTSEKQDKHTPKNEDTSIKQQKSNNYLKNNNQGIKFQQKQNSLKSKKQQQQKHSQKVQSDNVTHQQNQSQWDEKQQELENQINQKILSQNQSVYPLSSEDNDFVGEQLTQEQKLQKQKNKQDLLYYLNKESKQLFAPIQSSFVSLAQKLQSIQATCNKAVDKLEELVQINSQSTLDGYVKRYFSEMVSQVTNTVNKGYEHFQNKIQQLDKKSKKGFVDVVQNYRNYFDYQVKHRLQIFNKNRQLVQDELSWLKDQFKQQEQQLMQNDQDYILNLLKQKYWLNEQQIKRMEQQFLLNQSSSHYDQQSQNNRNNKSLLDRQRK